MRTKQELIDYYGCPVFDHANQLPKGLIADWKIEKMGLKLPSANPDAIVYHSFSGNWSNYYKKPFDGGTQ